MAQFPNTPEGFLLKTLAGYGVVKAVIEFAGSGDSGNIDNVSIEGLIEGIDPTSVELAGDHAAQLLVKFHGSMHEHDLRPATNQPASLACLVEWAAYYYLNANGNDWYNNDGGYGEITIVPGLGQVNVEMHIRYTETRDESSDHSIEVVPDAVVTGETPNG